ncbi:unnamed protein product [Periconia digitata]|uniref:F-box domain-containing protein n=1 Tax=Periconia digitata TaxID=1303443 RepID=A0A9W4UDY0_9PLEO|nr:unnamed protein product [Periconia digitata]
MLGFMIPYWRSRRGLPLQGMPVNSSSQKTEHHAKEVEALREALTAAATPTPQNAPLLKLPIELIQHISTYLPNISTVASFSLTSRYLYYAIGTLPLSTHMYGADTIPSHGSRTSSYSLSRISRTERRERREILERAFPSRWYCAWCDNFHIQEASTSPKLFVFETKRACSGYNSYLHDDKNEFVLCFHHVRLAVNRQLWGPEYGIGLDAFSYTSSPTHKTLHLRRKKIGISTVLRTGAKVVDGRFLLNVTYSISMPTPPSGTGLARSLAKSVLPILPQILAGHRDSHEPHTGFLIALEKALLSPVSKPGIVRLCSVCATDFIVDVHRSASNKEYSAGNVAAFPKILVRISVWRDLGDGRNPFNSSWRAHGEIGRGKEGFAQDLWRLVQLRPGGIKEAFEKDKEKESKADPIDEGIKCWIWEEEVLGKRYRESAKL